MQHVILGLDPVWGKIVVIKGIIKAIDKIGKWIIY